MHISFCLFPPLSPPILHFPDLVYPGSQLTESGEAELEWEDEEGQATAQRGHQQRYLHVGDLPAVKSSVFTNMMSLLL